MSNFIATTRQNEYVAIGATEVEAAVTVACAGRADAVVLRLWTPRHTTVECFTQVRPTIEDLATPGTRAGDHVVDHPVGAWGANESRDYYLRLAIPRRAGGEELLATKLTVLVDDREQARTLVKAIWTVNAALSGRIERVLADYRREVEPSTADASPLDAEPTGDDPSVTMTVDWEQDAPQAAEGDRVLGDRTHTTGIREDIAPEDLVAQDEHTTQTVRLREES